MNLNSFSAAGVPPTIRLWKLRRNGESLKFLFNLFPVRVTPAFDLEAVSMDVSITLISEVGTLAMDASTVGISKVGAFAGALAIQER